MIEPTVLPAMLGALAGLVVGFVVGIVFFAGLRLTIDRLPAARHPGALMLVSLLARMTLAVMALVALSRWGGWAGLLAGAAGLLAARTLLVRRARAEVDAERQKARR
ncbi:MAG: hypothetical protein EHM83_00835 [Burkholderiales bacterium]|nr:MAG: hypothetical protein EHM83_00835 [Burkholderiales bacterium]